MIIGRFESKETFMAASRLLPLASYIALDAHMMDKSLGLDFRRPVLMLKEKRPGLPAIKIELECQGRVIYKNIWNPPKGFIFPYRNPLAYCPNARAAIGGKVVKVAAFGVSPYIIFKRPPGGIDVDIVLLMAR